MAVFGLGRKDKDGADAEAPRGLQFDPLQAARLLPWLVALLLVLGVWCLVAGGLRLRDESRQHSLEFARDDAVDTLRQVDGGTVTLTWHDAPPQGKDRSRLRLRGLPTWTQAPYRHRPSATERNRSTASQAGEGRPAAPFRARSFPTRPARARGSHTIHRQEDDRRRPRSYPPAFAVISRKRLRPCLVSFTPMISQLSPS